MGNDKIKYDVLLFDLDGTISDPTVGITRSINSENTLYPKIHKTLKFIYKLGLPMACRYMLKKKLENRESVNNLLKKSKK